ncbi:hypothetical protein [Nocardia otitidiscaviarum]|uniref:hypothetical protein n=1 Tax=Nocardia otitidiscaviarum TaxID=1823 RepID=UPI002455A6B6|nr:hypothetical protein [Nocardia otitidiscaviarum]
MTRLIDYTFDGTWLTYVDERQLSAQLRQRLEQRRAAGYPPVHQGITGGGDPVVVLGAAGVLGAGALLLLLIGMGPLWLWGLVLAAAAVAAGATLRRTVRSTVSLTAGDRRAVAAATKRLYVPDPSDDRGLRGDPIEAFPVPELIARAVELRDSIADSPAWQSGYLMSHRLRLDLDAELDAIIQHALRVECASRPLTDVVGDSTTATTARQATENAHAALARVWTGLVARVSALTAYRAHLAELQAELTNAEIAERTVGVGLDITALMAVATDAELAADHIDGLRVEVRATALAINEIVETLNGDLNTLAALSAPRA